LAVKPVGFLEFLALEKEAELLLTDSGGVQEEGCILKVPCVTLRTSTERPETVKVGANLVAGHEPDRILACAKKMVSRKRNWRNPFGDGRTGERIVKIISKS
jgi:UDP-N-acetylglucosamine 2-epimerase (non-hydrolysing)